MNSPSVEQKHSWNQKEINSTLARYRASTHCRDLVAEQLWWIVRDEVMMNLRRSLRDDIAVEEAEFIALKELTKRLEGGKVKFISRKYIRFITKSAVRFVISRRGRMESADSTDSRSLITDRGQKSPQERAFRYADLYFCMEKLTQEERRLVNLHHGDDMKLDKVAELMEVRHDTLRKRHSRILSKLRECLESLGMRGWAYA